jgi:hypothetical protein
MSTIFMSPKGGNCTTVTATAYALLLAASGIPTVLIDLCGDATGLVTVHATMKKRFPLLGRWLPSLSLHGTATMMREPPLVLG